MTLRKLAHLFPGLCTPIERKALIAEIKKNSEEEEEEEEEDAEEDAETKGTTITMDSMKAKSHLGPALADDIKLTMAPYEDGTVATYWNGLVSTTGINGRNYPCI